MLCELSIKNFAIIDDLQIHFLPGLTILSGETGAGKSIIINAVNLLLGSRASASLIRSGCDMAELEASFEIAPGSRTENTMKEMGFDSTDELILQRQILQNNRNKIYINGRMATIQMLTAITENLASISGQHAHQGLLKEDAHLDVLDEFGGLMDLRKGLAVKYRELIPLIERRKALDLLQQKRFEHMDLLAFQEREILDAALGPEEDILLEQEGLRLKNSEVLYQAAYDCAGILYEAQGSVYERLMEVKRTLEKNLKIDPLLEKIYESINHTIYQVEDETGELRGYLKNLRVNPGQLEKVEDRLDLIRKLKRKYGGSIQAIHEKLEAIQRALAALETLADQMAQTEAELKTVYDELAKLAMNLSLARAKASVAFSKKVKEELADLMMPGTRFFVRMSPISHNSTNPYLSMEGKTITESGMDQAVFMMAPNVGEVEKPLAEIASGGELSRVVLALKSILAKTDSVETLVFDEVDAGIGGEVANVVGQKLMSLAGFHQVICITHLPQIARFGEHHYRISKQVKNQRTQTVMDAMNGHGRVEEIARMISGKDITPRTLAHAEEMLNKK
ncbi:MAG: DNA repair protein RecN [Desulfobacteraceae bacterium]|nr:DNA repair protein RecN [Desulfobacteraceae bacterium]MBU4053726.1 DNA repair protein RecN [Pseudomonadota bacterium]